MAYVNKAYQYHSHATLPVVIQRQQQQLQQQLALQSHRAGAQQTQPHVPVVYLSGRMSYAPHSALATGSRSSTMGARTNSTHSQSTTPKSTSLGGSKASMVSQRSGKTSIHQEYQDKKARSFLLAPYFGRGRLPYLIAIGLTLIGVLFVIAAGVVFGLRFHNNIMLTIDKGEIVGPVLIVIGLVFFAAAAKFYFDAYSVSNKERRKVQFSATRDNLIQVSVISANHHKQPGEAIVSGTATKGAVTRTPHGASVISQQRSSVNRQHQKSQTSGSAGMAVISSTGMPLGYSGTQRQPIEASVDNRKSAQVESVGSRPSVAAANPNSSSRPAETVQTNFSMLPHSLAAVPDYYFRPAKKLLAANGPSESSSNKHSSLVNDGVVSAAATSSASVTAPPSTSVTETPRASAAAPPRSSAAAPPRSSAAAPPRDSAAATSSASVTAQPRASAATPTRATAAATPRDSAAAQPRASAAAPPRASAAAPPRDSAAAQLRTSAAAPPRDSAVAKPRASAAATSNASVTAQPRASAAAPPRSSAASPPRASAAATPTVSTDAPSRASAVSPPIAPRTSAPKPSNNNFSNPTYLAPTSAIASGVVPSPRASSLSAGKPVGQPRTVTQV